MIWLVLYLAGAVISWPFLLRGMVRSEMSEYGELDRDDWVALGAMAFFIAFIWPVAWPFWGGVRWIRAGFERDEAVKEAKAKEGQR